MAGLTAAWLMAFTALAEAKNDTFRQQVVDKITALQKDLELRLEVSTRAQNGPEACTSWDELMGRFVLTLPRRQVLSPSDSIPKFTQQLAQAFEPAPEVSLAPDDGHLKQRVIELSQTMSRTDPAVETPLDIVVEPPEHGVPKLIEHIPLKSLSPPPLPMTTALTKAAATNRTTLPNPSAIPNPAILPGPGTLLQEPPYYLSLSKVGSDVEVSCSHSPTLVFLEKYLRDWGTNSPRQPNLCNALNLELHECPLGPDRHCSLKVSTAGGVSIPVIAAIIERTLGYEVTHSCGSWTLVRRTEFS